ncbi:MAG: hypothetical protein EOP78_11790 [Variovorax sp.]|nr:MAG: hypothetical protein EOP78_11790 [Variovorax sp.]
MTISSPLSPRATLATVPVSWLPGRRRAASARSTRTAVALHSAIAARPSTRPSSSALSCVVRVRMALSNAETIAARITRESAELLGLVEGLTAIALCKATAVQVERADAARRRRGNQLTGTIAKVARGDSGDEIVIALAGGLQLVGFAASGSGLRTRQRVTAVVDESAVVVALPG